MKRASVILAVLLLLSDSAMGATEEKSALQKYVFDGGGTMFFIFFLVLIFIALCIYNSLNLTRKKFAPADFCAPFLELMAQCRIHSAIEYSQQHPSFLARMAAAALPQTDATQGEDLGRERVEDSIADFIMNEHRRLMVPIHYLGLVAQAAPMLGLLGTVIGMVSAFATFSETGQPESGQFAGDISVALLTTMWGLITALPALFAYTFFKNRLQSLMMASQQMMEQGLGYALQTVRQHSGTHKIPEGWGSP